LPLSRNGAISWWVNLSHLDSTSQPLTFATRLVNATVATPGVPVTGAVLDANNAGQPWWVVGTGTQYHSRQDHLKIKLAYDLTPAWRASYLFGLWRNRSDGDSQSYLRDAARAPLPYPHRPARRAAAAHGVADGHDVRPGARRKPARRLRFG